MGREEPVWYYSKDNRQWVLGRASPVISSSAPEDDEGDGLPVSDPSATPSSIDIIYRVHGDSIDGYKEFEATLPEKRQSSQTPSSSSVPSSRLLPFRPNHLGSFPDLTMVDDLNEAALLDLVRRRFISGKVYV